LHNKLAFFTFNLFGSLQFVSSRPSYSSSPNNRTSSSTSSSSSLI
jgi:hypothetical protein